VSEPSYVQFTWGRLDAMVGRPAHWLCRRLGQQIGSRLLSRLLGLAALASGVVVAGSFPWRLATLIIYGGSLLGLFVFGVRRFEHYTDRMMTSAAAVAISPRLPGLVRVFSQMRLGWLGLSLLCLLVLPVSPSQGLLAAPCPALSALALYAVTCVQPRRPSRAAARLRSLGRRAALSPAGVRA
jgi:hypothetical protein